MDFTKAIEEFMFETQGKYYKQELKKAIMELEDAFRFDDKPRNYLGASSIVKECKRRVWYDYRHTCVGDGYSARMIRLFNRGHLEEARFVAILRSMGLTVTNVDSTGKQYGFSHGQYRGSGDGVCFDNRQLDHPTIKFLPKINHAFLLEFKTHNDRSFGTLQAKGLRAAKPEHFDQMQILMHEMRLPNALYMAVNKNDDSIFTCWLDHLPEVGEKYRDIAQYILTTNIPPKRLSDNATFFVCKMCDYRQLCHYGMLEVNTCCRTCTHVETTCLSVLCNLGYDSHTNCGAYKRMNHLWN